MSIELVTRAAKGAPLTNQEQDQNLLNLRAAIEGMAAGVFVASIDQDAETLDISFQFSDGSSQGPIVLPRVPVRVRGDWATATLYAVGDVFRVDTASYIVATAHQASSIASDTAAGKIMILAADAPNAPDAAVVSYTDADNVETTVEAALQALEAAVAAAGSGGGTGTGGASDEMTGIPFTPGDTVVAGKIYTYDSLYWLCVRSYTGPVPPTFNAPFYWKALNFPDADYPYAATGALRHKRSDNTLISVSSLFSQILNRLAALDGGVGA